MLAKKQERRKRALERLKINILSVESAIKKLPKEKGKVVVDHNLLHSLERMKKEEAILIDRLAGKKKPTKVDSQGKEIPVEKERWFIDIYQVHLGYVKNSERRKNKGKSRKKMRKQRSVSFVKSVVAQPGMMQNFRDGKMGISPKNHSFRMRKEEISFNS